MDDMKSDTTETRKEYVKPSLTDFGSFAEITQGVMAGIGTDGGLYS